METRILNIIKRAVDEFGFHFVLEDTLQDIFCEAQNAIEENVDYDVVSVCERNRHYSHITWSDDHGFDLEADGEFISSDDSCNRYFRKVGDEFEEIDWFEHNDDDYVLMEFVLDTEGLRHALVCK